MGIELDLARLRCFVAVADQLSFTKAAVQLNFAQSWVSSQIRKLEQDLGLTLFVRSTRRVSLTDGGRMLIPEARRMMSAADDVAAAVTSLRRAERGELHVGSPAHLAVTMRYPSVAALVGRWRDSVTIHNAPSFDLLLALQRGDLDIAFLVAPQRTGDLMTHVVESGHLNLLVPVEHELARYDIVPVEALAGQRILTFGRHHNQVLWDDAMGDLAAAGVDFVDIPEPAAWIMFATAQSERLPALLHPWIAERLSESRNMTTRRIQGDPCRFSVLIARRDSDPTSKVASFWEAVVGDAAPTWVGSPPIREST